MALSREVNSLLSSLFPYCPVTLSGVRHTFLKLTKSECRNVRDSSGPEDSDRYLILLFSFLFFAFIFFDDFSSTLVDSESDYFFLPFLFFFSFCTLFPSLADISFESLGAFFFFLSCFSLIGFFSSSDGVVSEVYSDVSFSDVVLAL